MAAQGICKIDGCGKPYWGRGWCQAHYNRWRNHGDPLGGGTAYGLPMRFFQDVVLTYEGDECLIWPYSRRDDGRATMRMDGRTVHVCRLACEARHGPPPTPEHQAAHSCGNGHEGCVTQKHLRWATRAENEADKLIHGTSNRGERNGGAKLTETKVRFARQMRGLMTQAEIASALGVVPQTVSDIQARKRWAWL